MTSALPSKLTQSTGHTNAEISTELIRHYTRLNISQDHHTEDLDKDVKAIKQVRVLSSDVIEPKCNVTYVITS